MKVEPCKLIEAVEVTPWTMKEGVVVEYKIDNSFWIPKIYVKVNHSTGNVKKSYIVKWVAKKDVGDIFTKVDFFKEFPKHKNDVACKRRVDEAILNMIVDKCIEVHDNVPGKYRVLK